MNILIVSQYFYPDSFRVNDIAAGLVRLGHKVTVLTGQPDYTTSRVPEEYRHGRHRRDTYEGADVIRVPIIERREGILRRAVNYASFPLTAGAYAALAALPPVDIIITYQMSPVFQAIPAIIYKKRAKKPLLIYCCDIWPEALKAWNVKESSPVFKIVKMMSRGIYRAGDCIMVTSRSFEPYLGTLCGGSPRIFYLPQHAEDLYGSAAGKYEDNGVTDFLFAGNIGSVQNVDCIIRAAAKVSSDKPFKVRIVGSGSELIKLTGLADSLGCKDKIEFCGRHPLSEMNRYYEQADCCLLTLRGGDLIGSTIPGKLQGYMSTGKPILAAADGDTRTEIANAGCGVCVRAGDDDALARAMEDVIADPGKYREMGAKGRAYFLENFTSQVFFDNLLKIIKLNGGEN